jgi:DNA-binding transcriptional LysR family regulator
MTLEGLRVFVAVAERQPVTRAAEAHNIAQSAVSASLGALEGRHGAKLFNRVGRRIELTEAGALFLAEARAVLARAESAGLVLSELGDLKRGVLSVHASQTIAGYWLPRHLVAFRRSHPGVAIRLSIENTNQAAAVVRGGEADLGFDEGEVDDPALISETVARDQLVIVIGAEHSWGEAKGLGKMDLLDVDWVLREPGSGTRSGFEHALGALSLSLHELRSRSSCPPMKRCAPRSKQAWARQSCPLQSPRRASKRGSFARSTSRFRNAAITRCATPNVIEAEGPRRSWTSFEGSRLSRRSRTTAAKTRSRCALRRRSARRRAPR